jgi:hypothetical protein
MLIEDLLPKILPEEECKVKAYHLNSEMAVMLMKTDLLAIRIEGAKKMDKLCKDIVASSKNAQEDAPIYKARLGLLQLIQDNKVLEEIYSKERCH